MLQSHISAIDSQFALEFTHTKDINDMVLETAYGYKAFL